MLTLRSARDTAHFQTKDCSVCFLNSRLPPAPGVGLCTPLSDLKNPERIKVCPPSHMPLKSLDFSRFELSNSAAERLSCLQFTMVTARWQAHGSYDEKDVWLSCARPIHDHMPQKCLRARVDKEVRLSLSTNEYQ